MNKRYLILMLMTTIMSIATAQDFRQFDEDDPLSSTTNNKNFGRSDSIQSQHKEIPKGLKVWTIDERFGDRTFTEPDTVSHMYMNSIFTTGLRGEYNTLGSLGSPRLNRIFIDREFGDTDFLFTHPYTYFLTPVQDFHFTNTLSPITNLSYNTCGNHTNGEDHFKAFFAVNAGKRLGFGFKFDYLYQRGYYSNQQASFFDYTMFGSYLGERYQAHLLMSTNHMKLSENGGITNDDYVKHPETTQESYSEEEIPTVLSQNWNRNDNQHIFFNHRYSLGFTRKVKMTEDEIRARKFAIESQKENAAEEAKEKAQKNAKRDGRTFDEKEYDKEQAMKGRPVNAVIAGEEPIGNASRDKADNRITVDSKEQADSLLATQALPPAAEEEWMKDEYVPVTSFIHTVKFDNYRRIYQAYETPTDYYLNSYNTPNIFQGDSIYDKTKHWELKNTLAVALLEGFNKWAKAGIKLFASYDIRHYSLPNDQDGWTSYNENSFNVGGQISKTLGKTVHYNALADIGVVGDRAGDIKIDANADLNFRLFGDTVQLAAKGFFYNYRPEFYYGNFHAKHYWWDNDNLSKITHTRIEGRFSIKRTRTQLRVAFDEIKNYTYLGMAYNVTEDFSRANNTVAVRQCSDGISLMTLQLKQDFRLGILNWENEITYQHSTKEDILPVPTLNIYTNLFLRFKIARVLKCDLGADMRYFTSYYAPDYSPGLGQFAIQETEASRVKVGNYPIVNVYANFHLKQTRFFVMMSHVNYSDGGNYFLTPHYPLNTRVFRFGVSWNFFN
ncbi:MAG: putative porin [Prevotella sp.]|nr:putative porin [Prevotella sp.]